MNKNNNLTKKLSNPFSTGSGGATFEHLVGSYYLSHLICKKNIYGHTDAGIVTNVRFQTHWMGPEIDDLMVVGSATKYLDENTKIHAKIIIQIKHDLKFQKSNDEYIKVLKECWQSFNHPSFNHNFDKIGILASKFIQKVNHHYFKLLKRANTSGNYSEFFQQIKIPNHSTNEMREYLKDILDILKLQEDEQTWLFLKHITLLELDLDIENSKDKLKCIENLQNIVKNQDYKNANLLFSHLMKIASEFNKNAGTVSFNRLDQDVNINSLLNRQLNYNFWEKRYGANLKLEFCKNIEFLFEESNEIRVIFEKALQEYIHRNTKEIESQLADFKSENQPEINISHQIHVILKNRLDNIDRIGYLVVFNQIADKYLSFFEKSFMLTLRIENECKFIPESIFLDLGKRITPLYIEFEFFSHKILTIIERIIEKNPNLMLSINFFYQGFIIGLIDTPYFDSTILHTIEKGLSLIYSMGYNQNPSKENNHLFNKTNFLILEIIQKITLNASKEFENPTSISSRVFGRIIEFVCKKNINYQAPKFLFLGVKLYHIVELINLPISFNHKIPILSNIIKMLKEILLTKTPSITEIYFFSLMQKVWLQLFNLETEPIIQRNPQVFHKFIRDLLDLYDLHIAFLLKIPGDNKDKRMISQMNRMFIDFLYYLLNIQRKVSIKKFFEWGYQNISSYLVEKGEKLLKKYPDKEYYKWILQGLIVMKFYMLSSQFQNSELILTSAASFDSLCTFGTLLISSTLKLKILDNKQKESILGKIPLNLIKKSFPMNRFDDFIEFRPGNWRIWGIIIGEDILNFGNILRNQRNCVEFLKEKTN
jgi:hypothetical protein